MAIFNFQRSRHFLTSLGAVLQIIIAGISALVQAASPRKLLKSERAANEMVGQMMLLAITVIGIGTITVYGVPTILALQDVANARNGEQSLTVIDSHANLAILGNSPLQTNNINLGGGTLTVEPNSTSPSYITVSSNNFSFTLPMGKIEYTLGDRIVAYEGGGMWTKYPSGKSIMLSPPALHYNGVMLSLPAINISGNGSVGGKGVATLSVTKKPPVVVFPTTNITQTMQTVQVPQNTTFKWDFSGAPATNTGCSVYCTTTVNIGGQPWTLIINSQGDGQTNWTNGYGNPSPSIDANVGASVSGTITWQSPNFTWNNAYGMLTSANLSFDRQVPSYSSSKDCTSTCSFSVVLVKPDGSTSVVYPNTPFSSSLGWMTLSNATVSPNDFTINGNYSLMLIATLSEGNGGQGLYFVWDNPTITLNYTVPGNVVVNVTDTNRTNPVNLSKAGNVYVNITSDFYDAWASYAQGLGYANVTKNDSTHTVSLNLSLVPNNLGENTSITNPIVANGLDPSDPTPLDAFSFMLVPFGGRLDWDIRTKTGKQKLIFSVTGTNPASLSVGYEDDTPRKYINNSETWNYTGSFPSVQNGYYIDMLNTSLNLTYNNITVSANNSNSCQPFGGVINPSNSPTFNSTQFSWPINTVPYSYTNQFLWNFTGGQQGWTPHISNYNGGGYSLNSSFGNPAPSIYSQVVASSHQGNYTTYATITWTSQSFTWNNGTPVSAQINFDWNLNIYSYGSPGSLYAVLVKPDGTTSQVSPTISLNSSTPTGFWYTSSNSTVSVNDFNQSGSYSLELIANLITQDNKNAQIWVYFDNPNITISSTGYSPAPQPTSRSLYDITQHYFSLMDQSGDLSFGDCGPYQPAANSTMLMDYNAAGGLTYLQISDNQVTASIN